MRSTTVEPETELQGASTLKGEEELKKKRWQGMVGVQEKEKSMDSQNSQFQEEKK